MSFKWQQDSQLIEDSVEDHHRESSLFEWNTWVESERWRESVLISSALQSSHWEINEEKD